MMTNNIMIYGKKSSCKRNNSTCGGERVASFVIFGAKRKHMSFFGELWKEKSNKTTNNEQEAATQNMLPLLWFHKTRFLIFEKDVSGGE